MLYSQIPADIWKMNSTKTLFYRNMYFVNYVYSQLNNLGNCGEISARVMFEYFRKLKKHSDAFWEPPRIQIVTVETKDPARLKGLGSARSFVTSHSFFVIGGNYPAGKFEIGATKEDFAKGKYSEGWICDIWNKDIKFGAVKNLSQSDPKYDVSNWQTVEIHELSLPWMGNYPLAQIDFLLNPKIFMAVLFNSESLMTHMIVDVTPTAIRWSLKRFCIIFACPIIQST